MSLATVADADLVARCRQGDQEAWDELVNRFSRYVYAIAVRVYRLPDADAEDVFQDVFTRTWQHLDELRDDTALRPWIATLTRRLCVDRLRGCARELPADEPIEIEGTNDELAQIDEALMVHEAHEAAPGALRRDPGPLLRPRRELSGDRRGPRHPPRHDRQPDLPLPAEDEDQLEGRKERFQPSDGRGD